MGQVNLKQALSPRLYAAASKITETLENAGYEVFLIGGSVRDILLKRNLSDLDFTTNALPGDVRRLFPSHIPVGEKFGTILVLIDKIPFEVTTYRHETGYSDGRRPDHITFGTSLAEDVLRRDFTINGLAVRFPDGQVIDHVEGERDIAAKIIRCIGSAQERFQEDGLRPIRACRFAATLGFDFDSQIFPAILGSIAITAKIAPERFYDEWRKTLKIENRARFWELLIETGIYAHFFSKFSRIGENRVSCSAFLENINSFEIQTMGEYMFLLAVEERLHHSSLESFLSQCMVPYFRESRFPRKEEDLCKALLGSPFIELIQEKVNARRQWKTAISAVPRAQIESHRKMVIPYYGNLYHIHDQSFVEQLQHLIDDIFASQEPLYLSDLAVNGNDLKETLQINGPVVGELLQKLLLAVHENPTLNHHEGLLQLSKKLYSQMS